MENYAEMLKKKFESSSSENISSPCNSSAPGPSPADCTCTLFLRCSNHLFTLIQNTIQAAHNGGNYRFGSVAGLIREALAAYFDGKVTLSALPERGPKHSTTVNVPDSIKVAYNKLPKGSRSEIVERAIRSYLASSF